MKRGKLFFGMSVAMPSDDAVTFKNSLGTDERYYLLKVCERPKDSHIDRRERFVVVRHVHSGERVKRGYAVFGKRVRLV